MAKQIEKLLKPITSVSNMGYNQEEDEDKTSDDGIFITEESESKKSELSDSKIMDNLSLDLSGRGIFDNEDGLSLEDADEEDEYDDFNPEDEEIAQLRNLTPAQLKRLLEHNKEQIAACKDRIAILQNKIDSLETQKCIAQRTEAETQKIKLLANELREEQSCLEALKARENILKNIKPKYRPFPVDKLPKVILCSRWDNGMPKVVVCSRPKEKEPSSKPELSKEFSQIFTDRQIEMIEDEKRWMELSCGDLEMQIAGLKGKVRVISNENNVLKAVIEEIPNEVSAENRAIEEESRKSCQREDGKNKESPAMRHNSNPQLLESASSRKSYKERKIKPSKSDTCFKNATKSKMNLESLSDGRKPCQGSKGKCGKTDPCPKYDKLDGDNPQLLAITISSTRLPGELDDESIENYDSELENLEDTVNKLQTALDQAKKDAETLKSQKEALKCLKQSLVE